MSDLDDEMHEMFINAAIEEMSDEVVDAIRADERQMIVDFMRQEENLYECGEELADMIDELEHYPEEGIH